MIKKESFLDLFRPKWKNSNPEVRKLSVKKINNEDKLIKIFWDDGHVEVREEVLKKINNEDKLIKIFTKLNDFHFVFSLQKETLKKIKNKDFLKTYIKSTEEEIKKNDSLSTYHRSSHEKKQTKNKIQELRIIALDSLNDINLTLHYAKNDPDPAFRNMVRRHLITKTDSDSDMVDALDDEEMLFDFVFYGSYRWVGEAESKAIGKIKNLTLLKKLVINKETAAWEGMRRIKELDNEDKENVLAEIALSLRANHKTRSEAIDNIKNKKFLKKIIKANRNRAVTEYAIHKYYNVNSIKEIFSTHINDKTLLDIIRNIHNRDNNERIKWCIKDFNQKILYEEILKLDKNFSNLDDQDKNFFNALFYLMSDKDLLLKIVKNAENYVNRENALLQYIRAINQLRDPAIKLDEEEFYYSSLDYEFVLIHEIHRKNISQDMLYDVIVNRYKNINQDDVISGIDAHLLIESQLLESENIRISNEHTTAMHKLKSGYLYYTALLYYSNQSKIEEIARLFFDQNNMHVLSCTAIVYKLTNKKKINEIFNESNNYFIKKAAFQKLNEELEHIADKENMVDISEFKDHYNSINLNNCYDNPEEVEKKYNYIRDLLSLSPVSIPYECLSLIKSASNISDLKEFDVHTPNYGSDSIYDTEFLQSLVSAPSPCRYLLVDWSIPKALSNLEIIRRCFDDNYMRRSFLSLPNESQCPSFPYSFKDDIVKRLLRINIKDDIGIEMLGNENSIEGVHKGHINYLSSL